MTSSGTDINRKPAERDRKLPAGQEEEEEEEEAGMRMIDDDNARLNAPGQPYCIHPPHPR